MHGKPRNENRVSESDILSSHLEILVQEKKWDET